MKTTGRSARGRARSRRRTSLSIAPVAPEPQKTTTSSAEPFTAAWMIRRASSRSAVVCRPVAEASVCVFPYSGRTRSRMKSSMNDNERPDAVWSAYTRRRAPNGPSSTSSSPITERRMRSISGSGSRSPRDRVRMATDPPAGRTCSARRSTARSGARARRGREVRGEAPPEAAEAACSRPVGPAVRCGDRRGAVVSRARGARCSAARAAFDASSARVARTARSGADAIVASSQCWIPGFHTGDAMAARSPFATWSLRRFSGAAVSRADYRSPRGGRTLGAAEASPGA